MAQQPERIPDGRSHFFALAFLTALAIYSAAFLVLSLAYAKPLAGSATPVAQAPHADADYKVGPLQNFAATVIQPGQAVTDDRVTAFPPLDSSGSILTIALRLPRERTKQFDARDITVCRLGAPQKLLHQRAVFLSCPDDETPYCLAVLAMKQADLDLLTPPAASASGAIAIC